MITSTTPAEASDLQAAAIADAAWRLAYLRRLADMGMRLAEEVCERAINSPYHPEPAHEPARAFATVSRGVRLTLVLHERMEAKIIALRNGRAPEAEAPAVARAACAKRVGLGDAAADDGLDDAPELSDRSRETLRESESERFEALVSGPFDHCVAVIRAELGLAPDGDLPAERGGAEAAPGTVAAAASARGGAPGVMEPATPMEPRSPRPADTG